MAIAPDTTPSRSPSRPQFGISAMLWATLVVALALGYLRQFNTLTVFASAAIVIATAVIVGGLIGWPVGRIGDAAYWAVIIASAVFLWAATEPA